MNQPFGAYSQYYDLLYRDKDYEGETRYIHRLLSRYSPSCTRVLELGCGTGRHAALLAQAGISVTGVEISEEMLEQAQNRAKSSHSNGAISRFSAVSGDARTFRCNETFDAVLSLFHVVSYQTSNEDVRKMFSTASVHLEPGGVFIFDLWYGPAVLSLKPDVRVKRMEDSSITVMRIAEPSIDFNRNRVDVAYTILLTDKKIGRTDQFSEKHGMRYFFLPEIEMFAGEHGMVIEQSEEWMSGNLPSEKSWGVCFVAKKQ